MIVRIVQMAFMEDKVKEFTDLFEERKATIRSFDGCTHLELWQDPKQPNVFFTYSNWQSEAHLDHYRFSECFSWGRVKLRSSDELMDTRCMCAWGPSSPIPVMPQRSQSKAFSIALAMGLANTSHSASSWSSTSKNLSTSVLGTTST